MKKIVLTILAAAAILTTGCNEKVIESRGEGSVSFELAYDGSDYVTKAAGDAVSTDDFIITIERPADGWKKVYDRYADMPQTIDLGSGVYTLTATSPGAEPAAFDQPIYGGSKEFTVVAGQTTAVQLTCTLQNMKVTLKPTENFLAELSAFAVTVSNGDGTLVWRTEDLKSDDIKAGYFTVAPLHVHVDGRRSQDGSEASYDGDITSVAARDHHIITLDAQVTGSVGSITINVNVETNDKNQNIEVPGFDEIPVDGPDKPVDPVDPDDPDEPEATEVVWDANPDFLPTKLYVTGEGTELQFDPKLLVRVPGKIESFVIRVSDNFATIVAMLTTGGVDYLDLINDSALIEMFSTEEMYLPCGDELKGETEVLFDLSNLATMIPIVASTNNEKTTFTLEIKDALGEPYSKSLEFITITE